VKGVDGAAFCAGVGVIVEPEGCASGEERAGDAVEGMEVAAVESEEERGKG